MTSIQVTRRVAALAVVTLSHFVTQCLGGSITPLLDLASPLCESCGTVANAVSGDGQIVVGRSGGRAVIWGPDGRVLSLGSLGVGGSVANAVSADGSVVVGLCDSPDGQRAFRWTSSIGLASLGVLEGCQWSEARAISGDGMMIAGHSCLPVTWAGVGQCQPVARLTSSDRISAMSATGSVIVGGFNEQTFPWGSTLLPLRWTADGGAEALELLPGDHGAGASGVSADGAVVVGTGFRFEGGAWRGQAVVWDVAGGRNVATPTWATESALSGISANGRVGVGYLVDPKGYYGIAAVWHEFVGLVSLRELLQAQGADLTGWSAISNANAASSDGKVVVGAGVYLGKERAFRAEIGSFDDPLVPADLNFDGSVDGADLGILLAYWGRTGRTDLSKDGTTDGADLGVVLAAWGPNP